MFKKKEKNNEEIKKEKRKDDEKSLKEIEQEERVKNRKHNSRISLIQFIILFLIGIVIAIQLFFFVNNVIGFLFIGIFIVFMSLFTRIASPFNDRLGRLNKRLFWVFLVIGTLLTLMSFIFMHTA